MLEEDRPELARGALCSEELRSAMCHRQTGGGASEQERERKMSEVRGKILGLHGGQLLLLILALLALSASALATRGHVHALREEAETALIRMSNQVEGIEGRGARGEDWIDELLGGPRDPDSIRMAAGPTIRHHNRLGNLMWILLVSSALPVLAACWLAWIWFDGRKVSGGAASSD